MTIGSICAREVDTIRDSDSVAIAAQRMHQRAVGSLVVVNEAGRVIGIVTDRDLVSRVLAKGRLPEATPVHEIMTLNPKTITEQSPIKLALSIMHGGRFRRIPVVDQQDKLVGLISLDDVLMSLAGEFSAVGCLLKRETPRALIEEAGLSPTGIGRLQNESRLGVGD
jgi:CBS domain-containing protein